MANRTQDAAVSSSSQFTYHVFLSFRGENTRKTFTDHLYTALVGAGFCVFRDDEELERGEDIKSGIEAAIASSRSSIIVFSKDYASSSWCLDELMLILQCKKTSGLVVLPVFYDVDPASVRRQKGSVAEAFVRHEERFKDETDDRKKESWLNKVNSWRAALTEVATLSGMVLQNEVDGYESKFIQKIVSVIEGKLTYNLLPVAPYLVGIDARVLSINGWLRNGSTDVGIIGIYGMGGIGKTTIARFVFNANFERFKYRSFLGNIRETSRQPDGLLRLQRQLLSDILRTKAKAINNADDGINRIQDAVCRGRVLLVLDDVDHKNQLDAILGMRGWFYPGSKIIVTTRNMQLLNVHDPCKMYAVEEMDFEESLELFSWYAFGHKHPAQGYLEHSKKVIKHCQGLPLALQVLGSSLRGKRSVDVWRSALEKLEVIPHCEIQSILKISYESLQDDHDRDLFLEIACFFNGLSKSCVIWILDECNYYTTIGIENLVDRCLVTIDKSNKLRIHQLLQDMGRDITNQESPGEPGKRSRLSYHKDSFRVLKEEIGTETIQGLALNMSMLTKDASPSFKRVFDATSTKASLRTDAFSMMRKLRLLQINYVQLTGSYKDFPKKLRWLCWHGFPLGAVPRLFPFDTLVALDMQNSNLKEFWLGNKFLGLLKYLNLSRCHHLIKTPGFSKLPALEHLILKDCISLVEIDESIGIAEGLLLLNLRGCKSLKELPRNIRLLKFLEVLIISGCSSIQTLPTEEMKMESLKVFHADGVSFESVIPTTRENSSWREVVWGLVSIRKLCPQPAQACLPQALVRLSLVGCNLSENAFARVSCNFSSLKYLDISKNPFRILPDCFNGLSLKDLCVSDCPQLEVLSGISNVELLRVRDCPLLEEIKFQPTSCLRSYVLPYNCWNLLEFHNCFKLESLENIDNETINSLGLNDLESLTSIQIKFVNSYTNAETEDPIQGVYENHGICRIFSIFFPGNSVPSWFACRRNESFIAFTVPSAHTAKIRCLNICFVYKIVRQLHFTLYGVLYVVIHNLTKDMKTVYGLGCYGIPEASEYMMWLSQWMFPDQELEAGDKLIVSSLRNEEAGFEIKEVGVHFVYNDVQGIIPEAYSSCEKRQPDDHQGSTSLYFVGFEDISLDILMEQMRQQEGPHADAHDFNSHTSDLEEIS